MFPSSKDSVQLLNTAIIKSKEKSMNTAFDKRLSDACQSPEMESLSVAISHLSEKLNITRDQAAIQLVDKLRELDSVWDDYVMMEGINNLKKHLHSKHTVN